MTATQEPVVITRVPLLGRLLLVRDSEQSDVVYLVALGALLGGALALGQASAYALVLARYGAEALPWLYFGFGAVLVLAGLGYLALADRVPAERLFRLGLSGIAIVLFVTYAAPSFISARFAPAVLLIAYEIASEFTLMHLALYLHQNMDALTQKRLAPLALAGLQSGLIAGGAMLGVLVPVFGLEPNILVWALLLLAATLLISQRHRQRGISPYFRSSGHRHLSVQAVLLQIREGFTFARRSPLLRWLAATNFCLVVAIFTMAYVVSRIYAERFPGESDLGAFLGWLLLATGTMALALQLFVAGRLLRRFRLLTVNGILPAALVASFALIGAAPVLVNALVGSAAKDVLLPAIGRPARNALFAALATPLQGRARALMLVVVLPCALMVTALLLLAGQALPTQAISAIGIAAAIALLASVRRAAKQYPATVRETLNEEIFVSDPGSTVHAAPSFMGNSSSLQRAVALHQALRTLDRPFAYGELSRAASLLRCALAERVQANIEAWLTEDLEHLDARERILISAALDTGDVRHRSAALDLIQQRLPAGTADTLLSLLDDPTTPNRWCPVQHPRLTTVIGVIAWCKVQPDTWLARCAGYLQTSLEDAGPKDEVLRRVAMLKQTKIFAAVATEELAVVAPLLRLEVYAAGERIFDIDTPSDRVFVVVHGRIGISVEQDPRERRFITELGVGAVLGEIGCFDHHPRSATAHVLEPAELLALEKAKLNALIARYPAIALGLLRGLGKRLREATGKQNPASHGRPSS